MHFSAFIIFQIALVIGFQSVQAGGGKMKKMRKILCNNDYEDVRKEILECAETEDFSEYEDLVKPCCEGLESMEPEPMREYWCSKSDDEVKEVQQCIDGNVKESGKEDEIKQKGEPIEKCLEEKFGSKE
ncbi:unnamed protein product, partial [Larinioides sclopetarius]